MSDYSDEEQVKRLQAWWAENGTALIVGAAIGLAAIFGWRYYNDYQRESAEQASDVYVTMQQAVAADDLDTAAQSKNTLQSDHKGTPYAGLASLLMAQAQFESGDYVAAAENLDWVRNNSVDGTHKYLARVRLARVRWTQGDTDAALTTLRNGDIPDAFVAVYKELEGDILRAQGDLAGARAAYQASLTAEGQIRSAQIQQKLAQIAEPDPEILVPYTADGSDAELASDDAASAEPDEDASETDAEPQE